MSFACARSWSVALFHGLSHQRFFVPLQVPISRCVSKSSTITDLKSRSHWVIGADEGRTIVCYHPEQPFPYEHSLPIPRQESLVKGEDSVLKVQLREELLESQQLKDKTPQGIQLAKLMFTTKHRWFPPSRKQKIIRANPPPRDRDGM